MAPMITIPHFFENLFLLIATLPGTVLIAGDFNCTLYPKLDCFSGVDTSHSHSRKKLQHFIGELNLCDPWRVQNPTKREFSCFSLSLKNQSCTAYFLVSRSLLPNISGCQYDSTALSDHSPTSLLYSGSQLPRRANRWRWHLRWLQNSSLFNLWVSI